MEEEKKQGGMEKEDDPLKIYNLDDYDEDEETSTLYALFLPQTISKIIIIFIPIPGHQWHSNQIQMIPILLSQMM